MSNIIVECGEKSQSCDERKTCDDDNVLIRKSPSRHRMYRNCSRTVSKKTIDELNMQLRVACSDGQMHAVRNLLEEGGDPFHIDRFDGKTPLMVAASSNNPNVIVILLLHALESMSVTQYDKGIWVRDSDEYTAAHIAAKHGSVECLSVLLYFHPKLAHPVEDFTSYPSLLDVSNFRCFKSSDVFEFLSLHYRQLNLELQESRRSDQKILSISGSETKGISMSCDGGFCHKIWRNPIIISAMKVISSIPKASVFISLRIQFLYTVYILLRATIEEGYGRWVSVLHGLGISSIIFLWLLYSRLCSHNPGYSPVNTAQVDHHQISPLQYNHTERRNGMKGYDDALRLLYLSSNIARNSEKKNPTRTTVGSHSVNYCCHYCRTYRPLRSKHSTTLQRCIPHYDHYCILLKNHVGRDNYPYFIGSLITAVMIVMPLFLFNIYSYSNMMKVDGSIDIRPKIYYSAVKFIRSYIAENDHNVLISYLSFALERLKFTVQFVIGPFFIWCGVWWIILSVLLLFHIFLMCFSLTTHEFIDIYEGKNKSSSFSRRFRLSNITDSIFPIDDNCLAKQDGEESSLREPLLWRDIIYRIFQASIHVCSVEPVNTIDSSNKDKYS